MASNESSEEFVFESPNFALKRINKFWILKTNDTLKRLRFLDNAEDVAIKDNILIADDELFEIHTNKKGEYLFRKIEDVIDETYFAIPRCGRGKVDIKKEIAGESDEYKYDCYETTTLAEELHAESLYDEVNVGLKRNIMLENDTLSEKYDHIGNSATKKEYCSANISCLSKIGRSTEEDKYFEKGSEEYSRSAFGSAEVDAGREDVDAGRADVDAGRADVDAERADVDARRADVDARRADVDAGRADVDDDLYVTVPTTTLEGKLFREFDVEIQQAGLGKKICNTEDHMTLSIQAKGIILKDPKSKKETYKFPFNCIRRFKLDDKLFLFTFEVGRRCSLGEGKVHCITKEAGQIYNACIRKMHH